MDIKDTEHSERTAILCLKLATVNIVLVLSETKFTKGQRNQIHLYNLLEREVVKHADHTFIELALL